MEKNKNQAVPNPVEGKHIFQISSSTRIRFNAEGWVEEIGNGEMTLWAIRLQGKPNSKRDDIFARRYYDLLSRCVILDIHPKMDLDKAGRRAYFIQRSGA